MAEGGEAKDKVSKEEVKAYFRGNLVIDHYISATMRVGLWASEVKIVEAVFSKSGYILDLGCGTGRISFGLRKLGYEKVAGGDLSEAMIAEAQELSDVTEAGIEFRVVDATDMPYADGTFDGVIFGFNGMMQIPGRENRLQALKEIKRVLKREGSFVFTTHDRGHYQFGDFWVEEAKRWEAGRQRADLNEFGDRYESTEMGELFMHVPSREEVERLLEESGWKLVRVVERSMLAIENEQVRAFSDECLFWVVESTE